MKFQYTIHAPAVFAACLLRHLGARKLRTILLAASKHPAVPEAGGSALLKKALLPCKEPASLHLNSRGQTAYKERLINMLPFYMLLFLDSHELRERGFLTPMECPAFASVEMANLLTSRLVSNICF